MGYGSSGFTRCTTWASVTSSSYPPGARLSARTLPVTITLDSWVSVLIDSNNSGETAFLATTPWMTPLPSRNWGKSSLPLSRRLYSQPRMVTDWPSCLPISAMVLMGVDIGIFCRRDAEKIKFLLICDQARFQRKCFDCAGRQRILRFAQDDKFDASQV